MIARQNQRSPGSGMSYYFCSAVKHSDLSINDRNIKSLCGIYDAPWSWYQSVRRTCCRPLYTIVAQFIPSCPHFFLYPLAACVPCDQRSLRISWEYNTRSSSCHSRSTLQIFSLYLSSYLKGPTHILRQLDAGDRTMPPRVPRGLSCVTHDRRFELSLGAPCIDVLRTYLRCPYSFCPVRYISNNTPEKFRETVRKLLCCPFFYHILIQSTQLGTSVTFQKALRRPYTRDIHRCM